MYKSHHQRGFSLAREGAQGNDVRFGIYEVLPKTEQDPAAIRIFLPLDRDATLVDYTAQNSILDRVGSRLLEFGRLPRSWRESVAPARQTTWITLVETDGTAWTMPVQLSPELSDVRVPLDQFRPSASVMLPLGYPDCRNYWVYPPKERGGVNDHIQPKKIEQLQVSLRPTGPPGRSAGEKWVDIARVAFEWPATAVK